MSLVEQYAAMARQSADHIQALTQFQRILADTDTTHVVKSKVSEPFAGVLETSQNSLLSRRRLLEAPIMPPQICKQQKEIEALKEKLNTNSNNSSKPPSKDFFKLKKSSKEKNLTSQRKKGGQPNHPGVGRSLLPKEEVDQIERHLPQKQCPCGGEIQLTRSYRWEEEMDMGCDC